MKPPADLRMSRPEWPAIGFSPAQTDSSRTVLYVEDDVMLGDMFAELLRNAGYDVDVARDGEAAWEAMQRRSYGLLITDVEMPRLGGVELLRRLRTAGITLPAVVVSGGTGLESGHLEDGLRVSAVLRKPFEVEDLLAAVARVLRTMNAVEKRGEYLPVLAAAGRRAAPVARWGINE